ncbi:MAG: hypothetical protein AB8B66_01875 [Rickettsiaceae bacterium]
MFKDKIVYEIEDLEKAQQFLLVTKSKIILTNKKGSTQYYGMRVLDYMFQTLVKSFSDKIEEIIIDTDEDYSALVTAQKLGYKTIYYKGNKLSC